VKRLQLISCIICWNAFAPNVPFNSENVQENSPKTGQEVSASTNNSVRILKVDSDLTIVLKQIRAKYSRLLNEYYLNHKQLIANIKNLSEIELQGSYADLKKEEIQSAFCKEVNEVLQLSKEKSIIREEIYKIRNEFENTLTLISGRFNLLFSLKKDDLKNRK